MRPDFGLVLIILITVGITIGPLLALLAAWQPIAGAAAITLAITAAVFIPPDA